MSTTMKYGHLSEKEKLQWELDSLRQENSRLREALEFYADHENYHAIAFLFDRPCGAFADDFSAFPIAGYNRSMPGVRAREALNPPKNR